MEPKTFGPFLKNRRTERGLTQSQLAEGLGVTTAAVSKWECGKCLPDLAKLEDLAVLLDLSVLEVLKCEVQQVPLPREELCEVYEQTLHTSRKQYRRRINQVLTIVGCIVLLFSVLHYFPVHHVVEAWWGKVFTTHQISDLLYVGSREDRQIAKSILARAEQAFSDFSLTAEEALEKYGRLARYSYSDREGVAAETHTLNLWSAHFTENHGTMWVYYSQEALDASGQTVSGSWRIPAYWVLEKDGAGLWHVTAIKEAP